jgi:hypothetical protein
MAEGDLGSPDLRCHLLQEGISDPASRFLQGPRSPLKGPPQRNGTNGNLQPKAPGQIPYKVGVSLRFLSPQHVIQVGHMQAIPLLLGKVVQQIEEDNRVNPSGDRHHHLLSRKKHTVFLDGPLNLPREARWHLQTLPPESKSNCKNPMMIYFSTARRRKQPQMLDPFQIMGGIRKEGDSWSQRIL